MPPEAVLDFPSSERQIEMHCRKFHGIKQPEASSAGQALLLSLLPVTSLALGPSAVISPVQGLTHEPLSRMQQHLTCSGCPTNLNLCSSQSLECHSQTASVISHHLPTFSVKLLLILQATVALFDLSLSQHHVPSLCSASFNAPNSHSAAVCHSCLVWAE